MAGEGGPGPAESLQGPADGSGGPSGAGDGHHDGQRRGQPGPQEPGADPAGSAEVFPGPSEATEGTETTEATEHRAEPGPVEDAEDAEGAEQAGEPAWPPPDGEPPVEPEPMRQVAFMGVVLELPSVHPSVLLHEIDPPRRELRVTIAQPEGVAIAYAWRGMATPRPLTHDLLTTILQRFGLQVDAVRITGVDGPVFHAELAMSGPGGSHTVECRPSDALALALRQPLPVPIMVADEVLAAAGRLMA